MGTLGVMFWGAGFGLAVLGRHHTNIAIPSSSRNPLFDAVLLLITPPLLTLSIVDWVANFISISVVLDLVLIIARQLHLSDITSGVVFSLAGQGNLIVVAVLDRIQNSRNFDPAKTLWVALGVSTLGALILLLSNGYDGIIIGYVVLDAGMATAFVMTSAMRNMLTPHDKLLSMQAGLTFSNQLLRALGAISPGLLFIFWNGHAILGMIVLFNLGLFMLVWISHTTLSALGKREKHE